MSVWTWIAIGVGSFVLLSLLVGLAVIAILVSIGQWASELYEDRGPGNRTISRSMRKGAAAVKSS